ncbi:S9 family peptidase [Terrimonas alba]|uniref:S9 family peptidase n=1 Tax=Terrimonas alba TaxID=3349636 RepID=UPI0035F35E0F
MKYLFRLPVLVVFFLISFQSIAQGIKWTPDGTGYYANEKGVLVKYLLPSFTRTEMVLPTQLTQAGTGKPLAVRDFSFSNDGKTVLIYTNSKRVWRQDTRGDYWILNRATNTLKQLGKDKPASSLMFAKISPDGKNVAYVSGHNIYVEDITSGSVTALTTDGTDRLINGTFDWVYEEEFNCRDGFRWSPDSKSIAYWQIDATKIRNFLLINNTDSVYSFTIPVEYPKVGEDPSACKVGVVSLASKQTTWMNVPGDPRQHYIPAMEWSSNAVMLQQLNRKQNEANVFLCDPVTGESKMIYTEKNNSWIDVEPTQDNGWRWINGGKEFLWISEKDGWRHLYRISADGKKETVITKGDYDMISLRAIDEKGGFAYFLASPSNATQQYLYRTSLNGKGKLELLSPADQQGTHNYTLSPNGQFANHSFSNHKNQRVAEWVSFPGHKTIKETTRKMETSADIEMIKVTTEDNVTLDGWMIKPKNFDSTKKYPVLFYVYTEPAGATVKDAAGSAGTPLYAGDIAADGYIQISLDGRGTPVPKGTAWRKAIYQNIGIMNIRDQAMAAKKIVQWPFVDTNRIAVHGWSGGGSTTLNLLFQYPDIYKTGIAIASVPNQLLYDNIYQERYMGLPQENKEPFIQGSPITHAKSLRGNLLLVHGTGDDNVHYQGAEMLINELVKNGKQFQLMVYPNRTHGISEGPGTSAHLSQLFTTFLKTHCPGGGR